MHFETLRMPCYPVMITIFSMIIQTPSDHLDGTVFQLMKVFLMAYNDCQQPAKHF